MVGRLVVVELHRRKQAMRPCVSGDNSRMGTWAAVIGGAGARTSGGGPSNRDSCVPGHVTSGLSRGRSHRGTARGQTGCFSYTRRRAVRGSLHTLMMPLRLCFSLPHCWALPAVFPDPSRSLAGLRESTYKVVPVYWMQSPSLLSLLGSTFSFAS